MHWPKSRSPYHVPGTKYFSVRLRGPALEVPRCWSRYEVLGTKYVSALLALAILASVAASAAAQPAPYHHYSTLETPHFHVHVAEGLEREGRVAGAAAERAYALLSRELTPPRGPIDLVVSDDADYANGSATPVPSNRINVFAVPPVENQGLRFNDDWIEVVVSHELTHIFHLDRARGIWGGLQRIFGRAPFFFPNVYGPAWLTEGLAVYYESRITAGGRLNEQTSQLVARAAAREGRLPRLDQLSLASPGFPGGEGVYGYGSLFIEYLARTRGDSTVGRFVEAQSGQLVPFRLNHAANKAFGVSFSDAFGAWRDSVVRATDSTSTPFPGWRDIAPRSLYAPMPRWIDPSHLVYSGTDGRETNAAWIVTPNGERRRLGRRDGRGANVPLADGSLLYSGLDFTSIAEVRSDLYRQHPDGRVQRLTRGARLIQPDARNDGTIVAVRLSPARSDLVLLDSTGALRRVLREAPPDETWSEPAWSPDGRSVVAVRRRHGGEFSLEVIDVGTNEQRAYDRGRYVIASPRWSGSGMVWTSERFGAPALVVYSGTGFNQPMRQPRDIALYSPDVSSGLLAATVLRADGFHLGLAGFPRAAGGHAVILPDSLPPAARADSEPQLAGAYERYSPWRSLAPHYWLPVIEPAASAGTRLGAFTSGEDVLGRHQYAAYAALATSGEGTVGGVFYRYAGLRHPLIDVTATQDWISEGGIYDQLGFRGGTLLKRTQDLSLAATVARPRVRSYASVTAGVGVERRAFATDPVTVLATIDPAFARQYTFPRAFVGAAWGNAQRPALSISPEDGLSLAFTARERLRTDAASSTASLSVVGTTTGYRSLDLPGFAHHVLAMRLAGGWTDRRTGTALEVGGTSSAVEEIIPGYTVGEGRRTFSVRGFQSGAITGTSAATASLEYRAPLMLGGRGFGILPFFFDRASVSAFTDAGTATCAANPLYASICSPAPIIGRTIASVGGELGLSLAILSWDGPEMIRAGFAVPVAGRALTGAKRVSGYVAFGLSY